MHCVFQRCVVFRLVLRQRHRPLSAVLGDDTGCAVATTYNVCACEYVEVYEGENNLKLPVSPLLSEHILSFLNEGNAGRRSFRQDMLQSTVWSVDYGTYSVAF